MVMGQRFDGSLNYFSVVTFFSRQAIRIFRWSNLMNCSKQTILFMLLAKFIGLPNGLTLSNQCVARKQNKKRGSILQ